jgi:hypothetical protein
MLKKQHVFLRRRGVWLWLGAKLRLGREVNADRPLPENISIPIVTYNAEFLSDSCGNMLHTLRKHALSPCIDRLITAVDKSLHHNWGPHHRWALQSWSGWEW